VKPPSIEIVLELEAAPSVFIEMENAAEAQRILDWVAAHPSYLELVEAALALQREERAA
jgi:hypothetical protein